MKKINNFEYLTEEISTKNMETYFLVFLQTLCFSPDGFTTNYKQDNRICARLI